MPELALSEAGIALARRSSAISATVTRARPLLGTRVAIRATSVDEMCAHEAIDAAFAIVERIHVRMSFQEAGSDLGAIARGRAGEAVPLDPETAACLAAALALAEETDGVFDPVLPEMGATWRDATVVDGAAILARPLRIDLSGIAKGHAVDRACAVLREYGVVAALVDAGGDLRGSGPEAETIALTPAHPAPAAAIRLEEGALASSDVAESLLEYGSAQHRDGRLGTTLRPGFAAVTAPDCRTADALTKPVLALGSAAAPLLRRHGARAWLHRPGGAWQAIGDGA